MLKKQCLNFVRNAVKAMIKAGEAGELKEDSIPELIPEIPKNTEFGDFAVNVSSLSRYTKQSPVVTASDIVKYMTADGTVKVPGFEVVVAGGFINFKTDTDKLNDVIIEILNKKTNFGSSQLGNGKKVILEYVSANPTGPFHIGHGRWAAVGSTLADVMKFAGYDVFSEFYVNDAGNQMNNLGKSLYIRVLQQKGIKIDFPEDEEQAKGYYVGEYLIDCAEKFVKENPESAQKIADLNLPEPDGIVLRELSCFAEQDMIAKQKALLEKFKTNFDNFYFETSLHERGDVAKCIEALSEKGKLYEKDSAIWFRSSDYGDDSDRVIKKSDGAYTYLTADIAYHYDKLKRGFDEMINIWGADHHGYIPRIKASIEALGYNPESLKVLLGQLVNLTSNGRQIRMGKRTKMITLDELIDEVGVDAVRFWMVMRNIDNTLEFDIDLAKSQSEENPVFYVQYAHARGCSVLRNAVAPVKDIVNNTEHPPVFTSGELDSMAELITKDSINLIWQNSDEKAAVKRLILKLEEYKSVIENSVETLSPYMITKYMQELAAVFHKFYTLCRVLGEDKFVSYAKLSLVKSTIYVLKSAFNLIGVNAPEKM